MKTLFAMILLFAVTATAEQNVVVVFDDSGSMGDSMGNISKIEAAKKGLYAVLSNLPSDSNVGIVCLNSGWVLPMSPYNLDNIKHAASQLRAGGGTPLGASMKAGADALLAFRTKHKYGVYRLLIITDGAADDSTLVEKYNNDIRTRNIIVDVIGVQMNSDHQLATRVNNYRRADDSASLNKAMKESLAETGTKASDISSYDEIASIPDDTAKAIVSTVVSLNNSPIGEPPISQGKNTEESSLGGIVLTCGIIVFLLIIVLCVIATVAGNHRRHNHRYY